MFAFGGERRFCIPGTCLRQQQQQNAHKINRCRRISRVHMSCICSCFFSLMIMMMEHTCLTSNARGCAAGCCCCCCLIVSLIRPFLCSTMIPQTHASASCFRADQRSRDHYRCRISCSQQRKPVTPARDNELLKDCASMRCNPRATPSNASAVQEERRSPLTPMSIVSSAAAALYLCDKHP